jgi:hypothetical protein
MKTKFPAMMAGAAVGALFILGAVIGSAAAWDYRDGGSRYGDRGDFHRDSHRDREGHREGHRHDRGWGGRGWGDRYREPPGPRWYGSPRYRGPEVQFYVPPPVIYYPAYPAPVQPPVVQLSSCQETVGNGLIERYGPGSVVFFGGAFEGMVTLDRQPFNYRCAGGQVNIW